MTGASKGIRLAIVSVVVIVGAAVAFFGVLAWLSVRERTTAPIEVADGDMGVHVIIEPGDEVQLGLLGHPAHDDAAWAITAIDDSILETSAILHDPRSGTAPDPDYLAGLPAVVREVWSTLPTPDRPPDEVNPDGEMWRYPATRFDFVGGAVGESTVQLELRVDGELFHSFEFDVTVVDGDACEYFVADGSTLVPNRCG